MLRRLAIFSIPIAALGALMLAMTAPPTPTFADVRARWHPSEAQLLDRNGDPVHELRIDRHGRRFAWTPLDEISPALTQAIVTSEDHRFWSHRGVDVIAIVSSAARAVLGGRSRGASTITMQLASILDPSLGRSQSRKTILSKIQANLCRARARTAMVKAGNTGSLPEPRDVSRRVAGNRRSVARDVRQSAARYRLCGGSGAGRSHSRAECAPRICRDSRECSGTCARIVWPIARRNRPGT